MGLACFAVLCCILYKDTGVCIERSYRSTEANPEKRSRAIELVSPPEDNTAVVKIPLLGEIAAGKPIFADENFEKTISIPAEFVGNHIPHFALRVNGDSMVGAGILSGDIAIIEQSETARNGDIHNRAERDGKEWRYSCSPSR